jgi:hypothetical protein
MARNDGSDKVKLSSSLLIVFVMVIPAAASIAPDADKPLPDYTPSAGLKAESAEISKPSRTMAWAGLGAIKSKSLL